MSCTCHAIYVALLGAAFVNFSRCLEESDRQLQQTDWFEGFCNQDTSSPEGAVRSFQSIWPQSALQSCEKQPDAGSWIWPGRNWCWVAAKRHACYGHHTWYDAESVAYEEMRHNQKELKAEMQMLPHLPALQNAELCDKPVLGAELKPKEAKEQEQKLAAFHIQSAEAHFWFQRNVAVYVLNMPSATERWAQMSRRLQELEIHAKRLDGIDLSLGLDQAKKDGLVPNDWNFTAAKETMVRLLHKSSAAAAQRYLDNYGIGTVGCAAAHLRAMWQAASAWHSKKPLVLILEDDVWLEDDFKLKLRNLLRDEVPCDWDVISLRSQCPYGVCVTPHLTRVQPDGNEPEEMCRHGVNYGFYAMLYRADALIPVANALHRQIWNNSRPGCLANDVALAAISDRIAYYAVPSSQVPGFVQHTNRGSVRTELNHRGQAWLDLVLQKKQRYADKS
ncbi:unnamed protein product [Cladocopium goreaui]|uniref:Hexosyltransferase n=1 Tax=Cladocopium goreaui TaxID=2562237 RepID=A0A9P1GH62_9DINO|nr:unnamed protein product [Cladocopium goreaui]